MNHLGELISLGVAVSWTVTAWFADKASRRVGAMVTNVLRLVLAALLLGETLSGTSVLAMGVTLLGIGISILSRDGGLGFLLILLLQRDFGKLRGAVLDPVSMKYVSLITLFGPAVGVSLSLMAVRYAPAGIASTLMALTPVLILAPEVMDVLLGARKWTKTWTKRCWSIAQGTIMDKSVARRAGAQKAPPGARIPLCSTKKSSQPAGLFAWSMGTCGAFQSLKGLRPLKHPLIGLRPPTLLRRLDFLRGAWAPAAPFNH